MQNADVRRLGRGSRMQCRGMRRRKKEGWSRGGERWDDARETGACTSYVPSHFMTRRIPR